MAPDKTPEVYYASARVRKWDHASSLVGKLETMLKRAALKDRFEQDQWVAVKTHFGSFGAHRIVRPIFLRKVTDAIKAAGATPFVTDTVRIKGLDYLEVANANGINHLSVGAPVILADGIFGHDNILIKSEGLGTEVAVASAIHDAQAMVVVSHVKGHINAGYAGAIKNMAMGGISGTHRKCGWKCGRGSMHAIGYGSVEWNRDACELCFQCAEVCPLECISFRDDREFEFDNDKCWRCGRCTRVCPAGAIEFEGADQDAFMRSLSQAAATVLGTFDRGKVLYINFILEVQPECDCMPGADVPVVQDLGVLLSDDIVAVEQASADLIKKAAPLPGSAAEDTGLIRSTDILHDLNKREYEIQLDEAQKLGLGSRTYKLIEI